MTSKLPKKDSEYSWLVLAVVTFSMFLEVSTLKTFSILLPDLREQLSIPTWIIGSHISIISGWGCVLGLTASYLTKKIGARTSFMMSGIISSIGLVVCACATNGYMLLLGMILCGFIILQENVVIGVVPRYFEKNYNIAVNIYCFGTALGVIISPLIVQMLLDVYGWRGTILLFCGVYLQSIPMGAVLNNNQQKMDTQKYKPDYESLSSTKQKPSQMFISNIVKWTSKTLDTDLLTSLPFITRVLVANLVYGYVLVSWGLYIVSFALSNGASMKEAALVSTLGGVGIAIIKVSLPFLNEIFTYRQLLYVSSAIMSVSLALTIITTSVAIMSVLSCIFGIGLGMFGTQVYIATKDVTTEAQFMSAVGWGHLVYGLSMIIGATLTGLLFDVTGSFTESFLLIASVALLQIVSLGLEDIYMRLGNKC